MEVLRVCFSTFNLGRMGSCIFQQIVIKNSYKNLKFLEPNIYIKTIALRNFSSSMFLLTEKLKPNQTFVDKDGSLVKKNFKTSPKVEVVNLDGSRTTLHLEEAEKIARHKKLELIKEEGTNSKAVYKFKDPFVFHSHKTKQGQKRKTLRINSTIVDHDLTVKMNKVIGLLNKGCDVVIYMYKKGDDNSRTLEMIDSKIKDKIGGDYVVHSQNAKLQWSITISAKQKKSKKDEDDSKATTQDDQGKNE